MIPGQTISASRFDSVVSGADRGIGAAGLRLGLAMLSWPYTAAVALRNRLYDSRCRASVQVSAPVISVGNLTVGGTGKTPAVEYLARFFRQRQRRVAILSRGYAAIGARNDEACLLEENLPDVPHLQGRDRVELANLAVHQFASDVLILDDGFQHRRLARDLDIVLIDATRPWGYGHLLPRGLLREPVESLKRADVVMLTRVSQVKALELRRIHQEIHRLAPQALRAESVHRPIDWLDAAGQSWPLERIEDRPVAAFCGIGNPQAFRHTIEAMTSSLIDFRCYPDHHRYTAKDETQLERWAAQLPADAAIVTTQKDLVKLRLDALADRPLWALRIGLELVAGQESLQQRLSDLVRIPLKKGA